MTASNFKIALFAIALSPFILNAELRDDLYEDEDDVAYTDDRDDENEDGLYYDDDAEDDDLADTSYDSDDSYSERQDQNAGCHSPYHRMHFGVRHTEARGVGYRNGYTTLEGFGIYDHNPSFMPFLDLRGHVFNNGKLAGNVGIGSRSVLSGINHIIGAYLYYDVRQENHSFTVNQLSPGVELLGKRMEYRLNGYFPVGGNHSHKYGFHFSKFDGHNILLRQNQKFAMKGGDGEIGVHLTQSTKYDLYTGAGPYYFSAERSHGWGGKVRLLGRYKEYVSLEASYSYDRMFRSIVQGTIGFNYPFGKKLSRKDRNCPQQNDLMLSRAAFAPYRFEIPVVRKIRKNVKAINPATGKPWQVWFVDNTSSSSGTFQSPFPTLAQAQNASSANDMIYVFPGNGTTMGMDMGITLKNWQKLFGSSIAHNIKTTKGKMTIPAFSSTAPTITNTASVVTLANGNEVSGMNIVVTTVAANGIDGTSGINGATIDHNFISGNVNHNGININGYGKFIIKNNQITTSAIGLNGIRLNASTSFLTTAVISNNIITGYDTSVQLLGTNNSNYDYQVFSNTIQGFNFSGINLISSPPASNSLAVIRNNTITNNVGADTSIGINVRDGGVVLVENNYIAATTASTGTRGIFINVFSAPTEPSFKPFIKNNTVITGAGGTGSGLQILNIEDRVICTSITGNQITLQTPTGALTRGMLITTGGNGVINIQDFSQDQAPVILISGNVNLVAPGTCNQ